MPTFTDEAIKADPAIAALANEQARINAISDPNQRAAEQAAFNAKNGIVEVAAGTTPRGATAEELAAHEKILQAAGINAPSGTAGSANALQNKSLEEAAIKGVKVAAGVGVGGGILYGLYRLLKKVF